MDTEAKEEQIKEETKTETKEKKGLIAWGKEFFEKHATLAEIIRFLIIGGIATIIDFVVMGVVLYIFEPSAYSGFLDVYIGAVEPSTAATIVGTGVGFVMGLVFNYVFSVKFVYTDKGNSKSAMGFIMFTILSVIGLGIHLLGMWIGYDLLHINEWIVKIVLTFVVLVYNYISKKLIIFKKEKNTNEG